MGPSPSPVWSEGPNSGNGMARTLCGFGQALTWSGVCRCRRLRLNQETPHQALVGEVWFGQPRSSQGHWVEGFPAGASTQDHALSAPSPVSLPAIWYWEVDFRDEDGGCCGEGMGIPPS